MPARPNLPSCWLFLWSTRNTALLLHSTNECNAIKRLPIVRLLQAVCRFVTLRCDHGVRTRPRHMYHCGDAYLLRHEPCSISWAASANSLLFTLLDYGRLALYSTSSAPRSEERRVGKEGIRTCRYGW